MSGDAHACPRCGTAGVPAPQASAYLAGAGDAARGSDGESAADRARQTLAQALARPEEPSAFSLTAWLILLLIPGVNVLSIFVSPLTRGLKTFVAVVAALWVAAIVWFSAGPFADPFAARDAGMMVGATTLVLYFIALLRSWVVERREVRTVAVPAHRERVARWERLAWCGACGVVFLDGGGEAEASASGVSTLLGPPTPGPSRSARTPIWMWILLSAVAVWGLSTANRMAPLKADADAEAPAAPSPELWEDIEADPVAPGPGSGPGQPGAPADDPLDRPLVPPPSGP